MSLFNQIRLCIVLVDLFFFLDGYKLFFPSTITPEAAMLFFLAIALEPYSFIVFHFEKKAKYLLRIIAWYVYLLMNFENYIKTKGLLRFLTISLAICDSIEQLENVT